ncbi:MAG: hypothetical protein ACRER2_12960, partial [Methylococcales bacterium]
GPLPREAWPRFMRFALHEDIGKADADDYVRLIREAYLVPMGLLRRKGRDYVVPGKLDNLELVKLLMPMLKHNPSPKMIHQRLSEPVYGLVPDQINLLLVFLLLQGEIEVFKDQRSYRDAFETLENPLHYDRVELGQSLPVMELAAITRLAEALNLKLPQQWTLLAQKRAIENIREAGRQQSEQLQPLLKSLRADPTQGSHLCEQVQAYLQDWNVLRKGAEPLKGFQDFLSSIESIDSFIQQIPKFNLLQKRLPGLIEESQRFQHLFSNPVLQEKILRALNPQQSQLPEVPDLDNPDDLESWLGQARTVYADYKKSYSQAHAQWWARQTSHPALNWQAPLVANSRHIGLGDAVKRIRELQQRALQQRCRGLVNLDYQPLCSCGFDGESAPLAILIDECEKLEQDTERKLESFFQQDQVKETIGTWRSSADPAVQADLTQYLSGSRIIPRIHDLCWFDRNLSGDATLADGDLESVLRLLEEKIWEAEGLQKALTEHLARYAGRRIRFVHSRASSETSEELILWCAEQCLRFGVPLPERMSTRDLNRIQACLRPEWVGDQAIRGLEQLGLNSASVDKLLGWLINGQLTLPEFKPSPASALFAVRELLVPQAIVDARDLALRSESLYRHHGRLAPLAGKPWLDRLDELANTPFDPMPAPLIGVLQRNPAALWLLIDCWGLPLFRPLLKVIQNELQTWKLEHTDFALVGEQTTTNNCYRQLLNGNIAHAFEKCSVIDQILHDRDLEFPEFVRIVETELAISLKRLSAKLDPARDLLIFADHGFRLNPSGRSLQHGGPSMLERVVPVCLFCSREKLGVN